MYYQFIFFIVIAERYTFRNVWNNEQTIYRL